MDETVIKRIMPNNQEAEEAVIGSMLLDQEAVVLASEKLNENDFYNARYRVLFSAIVELFQEGRPADLVTLVNKLHEKNVAEDIGSVEFLSNIISAVPTSANIRYYADIVEQKSQLRALIRTTESIANRCYQDSSNIAELMEDTERNIFELVQGRASSEFAIAPCNADSCESPTIVGAKIADDLLDIKGIRATFVLTSYEGKIYISARSIDELNVQVVMEKMGGGGHITSAGAQLESCTLEEGAEKVKELLRKMKEEGDI